MSKKEKYICDASHICNIKIGNKSCGHDIPHNLFLMDFSNEYCCSGKNKCGAYSNMGLGQCIKLEDFIIERLSEKQE